MTQSQTILNHLKNHGDITSLEAFREYGITRLSARIFDLRSEGHHIKSENVNVPTRSGDTATVAKYTLIRKEQAELFEY
jgi:hypothetical protein